MVLWNAGRLAADLRAGTVSEREKLHYLVATLVLQSLTGRASLLAAVRAPTAALWPALTLAGSFAGLLACYRANATGDGQCLVERLACLGVPVAVRVYVGYALAAWLAYVLTGLGPAGPTPAGGRVSLGAVLVWGGLYVGALVAFFGQLRRHVAAAAGAVAAAG